MVDSSHKYVFYYNRSYRLNNYNSDFKSYIKQSNDKRVGLLYFKIGGVPTYSRVTNIGASELVSYSVLINDATTSNLSDTTWWDEFKTTFPDGYVNSWGQSDSASELSYWKDNFAKYIPTPVSNENDYSNYSHLESQASLAFGFDVFTLVGDNIYGTCSAFGGVFESEIYKLHFIGNAKVNWPACKKCYII